MPDHWLHHGPHTFESGSPRSENIETAPRAAVCDFLAILAPIDSSFTQNNQTALSIQLIWDIIRLFVASLDALGRTFECGGQKLAELQMKPPNWQTA